MTVRVGVLGGGGRMGSTVCGAIVAESDLKLVAVADPHHAGVPVSDLVPGIDLEFTVAASPEGFDPDDLDVVVDFTHLEAARDNLDWAAEAGIHAVVGTTGFADTDLDAFRARFVRSNCMIVPNFAIGAVLMMRFAELAAPFFETAEVLEFHHDAKLDAPSGTAMRTVERMEAASSEWAPDPTRTEVVPGARGGRGSSGVRVHSVRMRGMVAHQEVLLGTMGQTLSIRHDSYDRSSFMPGVVLAVRRIASVPGVTIGLDQLLDL